MKFNFARHFTVAIAMICLAGLGCAPQYHWYQQGGCCTGFHYHPPAPLPYTTYAGCPTPVASHCAHFAAVSQLEETTGDSDADDRQDADP